MREALRGALLSVLLLGGLALLAAPATADDKMKCKGKNCTDETTVTPKPDPHRGGTMIGWGPVVPETPPRRPPRRSSGAPAPSGDQSLTAEDWAAIDRLTNDLCAALKKGEHGGTIIAAILAIAKKNPVVFVVVQGSIEVAVAACSLAGK